METFNLALLETNEYKWIKNSEFYNSLNINENEKITFYICSENTEDIEEFLTVGKIWIVNFYPPKFYYLLLKTNPIQFLNEIFLETHNPFYTFLISCLNIHTEKDNMKYKKSQKPLPKKERLMNTISREGRLDFLIALLEINYPLNKNMCVAAAINGHLKYLIYIKENGCPWDSKTCSSAAFGGHLKVLKYAHENGCPWDKDTCYNASGNGSLKCLIYAHENDCPWDQNTCSRASGNGSLECLIYAHENGCPWDQTTCISASKNGHLECLKYAVENKCPINISDCKYYSKERNHTEIFNYLQSKK